MPHKSAGRRLGYEFSARRSPLPPVKDMHPNSARTPPPTSTSAESSALTRARPHGRPATLESVTSHYQDVFEPLRSVYLEDSWVLAIEVTDGLLVFDLDIVLTASHPAYRGPKSGDQYDYRRAHLCVAADQIDWRPSNSPPAIDATGRNDLGNIDSWEVDGGGWSMLEGDWGTAKMRYPSVSLSLTADS
jgi:hypothetical protein